MRRVLALLAASLALSAGAVGVRVEPATKGEQCIADTPTMRRDHMRMLEHQRDETVRGGIRGAKASLKGCIDCHASKKTGSVAQAPTDFCAACHSYAAVKIDCFERHASKPAAKAAAR